MTERRKSVYPRTLAEISAQLAPWLAVFAVLLFSQFLLVVFLEDMTILRLTENARTAFQRNGNIRLVDGLFSSITLLLTAIGIGACVLTATLPHLRQDDRTFATAIGSQFVLWAIEEQLQLQNAIVGGRRGAAVLFAVHAMLALAIVTHWRLRVVRVWPLIALAAASLTSAIVLDAFEFEATWAKYLEEWLELLGAVGLASIAVTLARQAIVDASRSRRFQQPAD